jgi:hypothetical protein
MQLSDLRSSKRRVVILHGLNMVNKRAPFTPAAAGFGSAAPKTLARNGFDTDGLTVKKYTFPLGYLDSSAFDRAYDSFWTSEPGPGGIGLQHRYVAAWKEVAGKFADDPWVIGYGLFNEPWPANASTSQLASFYRRVIAGIRSADQKHIIW